MFNETFASKAFTPIRAKDSTGQVLFWVLSIPVFYLIITLTKQFGVPSRFITVPYRLFLAAFGIGGLWAVLKSGKRIKLPMLGLLLFSFVFILRIIFDGIAGRLNPDEGLGFMEVFFSFLLCAFLPGFYGYSKPIPGRRTLNYLWGGLLVCCVLLYYAYAGMAWDVAGLRSNEVAVNESILNPIKIGHIGALLVELSLYRLLFLKTKWKVLNCVGFIGLAMVVMANSRSPLLSMAFVCCVMFAAVLFSKRKTGLNKFHVFMVLVLSIAGLVVFLWMKGGYIFERFNEEGIVDSYRQFLYQECTSAAFDFPFWGKGVLVLHPGGGYGGSESFVLDGFHATGMFFGVLWCWVLLYAIVKGALVFVQDDQFWVYLVFLHGVFLFGTCGGLINCIWGFVCLMTVLGHLERSGRPSVA